MKASAVAPLLTRIVGGGTRDRRAALGAVSLAGARGMALLLTLITVPLTLPYLGAERFGLWMTISSVVALVTFTDLGLGNGVMTLVAEDDGRDDVDTAAAHVSSAGIALLGVAAALGLGFAILYPHVSWPGLFNVSSDRAASEAGPAVAVAAACFLLTLPLSLVQKVQLGYQEGARKGLWDAGGSLLSLLGVVLVVVLGGSLPWLVAAFAGGPVLAGAANTATWFGRVRPAVRPHWSLARWMVGLQLLRVGSVYMFLQLVAMVSFFSDSLIVARVLGPRAVAEYSIAWKLFSVVSLTLSLALMPLWPAYSEAVARHDAPWVRRTLRRSIRLTLLATVPISCVLLALGPTLIHLWTGSRAHPPFGLLAGFALAMFLNALKVVRIQLLFGGAMAVVNVALSVVLTHAVGVAGVVLGTLISYSLVALLPLGLAVPRILSRLDERALASRDPSPPPPFPAELPAPSV
jgi:O-antigen/teichoic acid export membrane protein